MRTYAEQPGDQPVPEGDEHRIIGMPFEQQFWGAWMGNVTDRFGIHWMISHAGDTA